MAMQQLAGLGYSLAYGPDIAADGPNPERDPNGNYTDVVLKDRLLSALRRLNPDMPAVALEEAMRQVLTTESPSLIENNRRFHKMLTDGVDVSWMEPESERHGKVWLLDVNNPANNDWLASQIPGNET